MLEVRKYDEDAYVVEELVHNSIKPGEKYKILTARSIGASNEVMVEVYDVLVPFTVTTHRPFDEGLVRIKTRRVGECTFVDIYTAWDFVSVRYK